MARARSKGIELEDDVIGKPADLPVLLDMGLGAPPISRDDALVLGLARRGPATHFAGALPRGIWPTVIDAIQKPVARAT
jgi:hypothetical protein